MSGKVFHAPFINFHQGFTLVGAWERSKELIQQDYPETFSFNSLEAILNDNNVELIVVNTPTNTHYEYTRKALEAGKHVVVEKAFTTTFQEAVDLANLAAEKDLMLSVFQNRRWDSDFSTVRNVIKSGILGEINSATFNFLRFKPALHTKLHKETAGPGAGLLNDLGPHLIDQALSLWGMPHAVHGDLRMLRNDTHVDDDFTVTLHYNNMRVTLRSSLMVCAPQPAYLLNGSLGSFVKNRTDKQEDLLKMGAIPDGENWYTEPPVDYGLLYTQENDVLNASYIKSEQGSYLNYYEGIYHAIANGAAVPVTAQDGINTMRIIEAAAESSRSGKLVLL